MYTIYNPYYMLDNKDLKNIWKTDSPIYYGGKSSKCRRKKKK